MRRGAVALLGQRARRRWLHLIVGGALFMPFWMVGSVVVGALLGAEGLFTGDLSVLLGASAVGLPLVAVAAPGTRGLLRIAICSMSLPTRTR
ncbi:histidine kinase, partial [Streptomyces sp. NPDC001919]